MRDRLEELAGEGILTREKDIFRINPKNPASRDTINELARAYKERSIRVIQTIYSDQRRAMHELSDAFRFRRKEKDG